MVNNNNNKNPNPQRRNGGNNSGNRPRNRPAGAAASSVPRMLPVTRKFHLKNSDVFVLDAATTPEQSPLGVGSQFVSFGRDFTLRDFVDSSGDILKVYDQYKFDHIDVYLINPSPSTNPMLVHTSVDYDDVNTPTWYTLSDRSNIGVATLRIQQPMTKLTSFVPRGNFISTVGDSPTNVVPRPGQWWDTTAATQSFNGIKVVVSTEQTSATCRLLACATISFRGKI